MQARSAILKSTALAALLATGLSAAQAASFTAPTSAVLTLSTDLTSLLGAGTTYTALGDATYNAATRTLTESFTSVNLSNSTAADLVGLTGATSGLRLTASGTTLDITGVSIGPDRYVQTRDGRKLPEGTSLDTASRIASVSELGALVQIKDGNAVLVFDPAINWVASSRF